MGTADARDGSDLEFFGVKLKVNNPRLAALLNSDIHEDVQVIGRRAREAFAGSHDSRAERDVALRMLHADDPVVLRVDDLEGA